MADLPDLTTMASSGAWPKLAPLLADKEMPEFTFSVLCKHGYLRPAQRFVYENPTLKLTHFGNEFFHDACIKGHLEFTQWLHQTIIERFEGKGLEQARARGMMVCCRKGDLVMTQWLVSQGIPRKDLLDNMKEACMYGHLDIVQWLIEQMSDDPPLLWTYFLWSFKEKSFHNKDAESHFRPALTTWLWQQSGTVIDNGTLLRKVKSLEALEWLQEYMPDLNYTKDRYYLLKLKDQKKYEILARLAHDNPDLALTPAEQSHVIYHPVSDNYRFEGC